MFNVSSNLLLYPVIFTAVVVIMGQSRRLHMKAAGADKGSMVQHSEAVAGIGLTAESAVTTFKQKDVCKPSFSLPPRGRACDSLDPTAWHRFGLMWPDGGVPDSGGGPALFAATPFGFQREIRCLLDPAKFTTIRYF